MTPSLAPQKSESARTLLHMTRTYVKFGANRACFVTKQDQESKNRKIRNLENRNRRGNFNVFYERVNRTTSRDYNPIIDTDFASLVRYDRFPSLLYGSGATFLSVDPLVWRCRELFFSNIFGLYNLFDKILNFIIRDILW